MGKSSKKLEKVVKIGGKWGKMGKSGEKWGKVGKSGKSGEKLKKWGKSGKKWGKAVKSGAIFSQIGRRRPFWMTENHFRSHFSPFQINTQLLLFLNFVSKWPPAAILDDRKSLSLAFLAISDQYATFF